MDLSSNKKRRYSILFFIVLLLFFCFVSNVSAFIENEDYKISHSLFSVGVELGKFKEFKIPEFLRPGEYIINVQAEYLGISSSSSTVFIVLEPFMDYKILGILPIRWVIFVSIFVFIGLVSFIVLRRRMAEKKRYKGDVDIKTLPKPGDGMVLVGKLAETEIKAYYDLLQLKTHTLIAGSTGGGKTVSAEVLVEEALIAGVAIVVFDPTAQWSGFLRKCANEKMLKLYKNFGLKKTQARGFNGNVHQMLNPRQIVDIKDYMTPGEIHVFAVHRLDPKDTDILVANAVREVFHANLPESPELRLVIIFDEVHRLLPKFGGSGRGFLQIERGAREFRKWGVGLILISQVLTDFIGETKANINSEIQMRTRDEGDLNRIKDKYGPHMLQSLLKSATGTGMFENPAYNKGNPYFISFRPLFHEHARLSDEELNNYDKYNNLVDDLKSQIDQLKGGSCICFFCCCAAPFATSAPSSRPLRASLDFLKSASSSSCETNLNSLFLGFLPKVSHCFLILGVSPSR